MLTQAALDAARQTVYRYMQATPSYAWPQLSEALGTTVWAKHENHTPIGAFKARGGLVYLDQLVTSGFAGELVTATRGNHGQSIPFAARQFSLPVHVYVPHGNAVEKNAAMRGWGAQLIERGADFDAAREAAERHVAERGGHLVPSYHEHIVAGVATYCAELFAQAGPLDAVYVPIGMGSGAAAMIAVRDLLGVNTEVVGVVSAHADAYLRSWEGRRTGNHGYG